MPGCKKCMCTLEQIVPMQSYFILYKTKFVNMYVCVLIYSFRVNKPIRTKLGMHTR